MKFWTLPHQVEWLKLLYDKLISDNPDKKLLFQIGYFTNSYALVEMRISLLLAKATGITQLKSFDLLTRGMDVRVKIERLQRACESGPTIGPKLHARLNIMNNTMRPLRNKIAHTFVATEDGGDQISFTTLLDMPKFVENRHPDANDPYSISMLELFEHSAWLRFFGSDLRNVYSDLALTKMLEIASPTTPLLPGSDQSPDQPNPDATPGKRQRKRQRKGQPPRGKPVTPER